MKLKPFKELIALSKEKLDEAMAPIRARQVKSQAELEMAKLDASILTAETDVQESCAQKDIHLPSLINKLDNLALLERRKEQYGEIITQLFPEGEAA